MVDMLAPGLFRLEIPVPRSPLKIINDYFIQTPQRNLLIDTGMNLKECQDAMDAALAELGADLEHTDVFLTHMHADHAGMTRYVARPGSKIYCSQPDAEFLSKPFPWDARWEFAILNGFPPRADAKSQNPDFNYFNIPLDYFTFVKDGDVIRLPGWNLRCIFTPGHTFGHMCLYDEDRKWLFSGDHVLSGITPNLSLFFDNWDQLKDYLNSLTKVEGLDVEMTFPGHRHPVKNLKERIIELRNHHHKRCNDILNSLSYGPLNAFHIAGSIDWDLSYESWEDFPHIQKWFAHGEVMAHLKYLEVEGKVQMRYSNDGVRIYQLV